MSELVLAVDAGSGSCRAAVYDVAGELRALASAEWHHRAAPGVPGGRDFDTAGNWALVGSCVRAALADVDVGALRAVATTSFRGGLVLFDRAGRELWACPNGDARAGAEARALVESGAAAELQARGGDWVSLSAPPLLAWVRSHEPAVWRETASLGLINDWLVRRLTDSLATDPSVGSSSGLFDLNRRTWSDASLALCELPGSRLPAVADAGTVVGTVSRAAASETGLPEGLPVALGGADTPLGLLGLGVGEPGRLVALGGTHWQQSLTSATPLRDPGGRLRTLCHALPGQWLTEGIGFHSGLALRWFRDAFCPGESYAALEELAATVPPGAGGVVAVLANTMDARAWAHAPPTFTGFDLSLPAETGKAAFIRAILEAAAFVARAHVEALESVAGRRFDTLLLAGGVAHGALWPQIVADVLGREVVLSRHREATVRGAALAASVAAGWHRDLAAAVAAEAPTADPRAARAAGAHTPAPAGLAAAAHTPPRAVRAPGARTPPPRDAARTLAPDPLAAAAYDELFVRWRAVYDAVLPAASVLEPLWRAPGV